jgi:hypothetical protein
VAYVRTVKTASGATAVQIVHSWRKGSGDIEHIGSAHDDAQLALLKAAARQRLVAGQGEFDLGLDADRAGKAGGPLPITSSRMGHLWDALSHAYDALGFDTAADGDEVFRCLVLARIIEPTSKLDCCGSPKRSASDHRPTRRSTAVCRCSPRTRGGSGWRRCARTMWAWDRRGCCSTT